MNADNVPDMPSSSSQPKFSAFSLRPNATYRVTAAFVDFDGETHPVGERWRFLWKNFLPYDDGLSLFVDMGRKAQIRLQCRKEEQAGIVDAFSDYVCEEIPSPSV